MKFIFVIQGEGRGHLTQALALSSLLRRYGHTVDEVLVGRCKNREIPEFFARKIEATVTLFHSPTFDYGVGGKRGNILKTIIQNTSPVKIKRWHKSVELIRRRIEKSDADVVINFYEFLLGVTSMLHSLKKPIYCIGHQFIIDHPLFDSVPASKALILKVNNLICAYGSMKRLALSFYPLAEANGIEVVPPLLRPEIFEQDVTVEDFTLGYMLNPAYLEEVLVWKSRNPDSRVHLFWDKQGAVDVEELVPGLWLHKINDSEFLKCMSSCRGYITTAGFESVCEAMYLGKPVLMIPAHIEQQINAADAAAVGAGAISKSFNLSLLEGAIEGYSADTQSFREWVDSAERRFIDTLTKR